SYDLKAEGHRKTTSAAATAILSGTSSLREADIEIAADLGLRIATERRGGFEIMLFGPALKALSALNIGISQRDPGSIITLVQDCRTAWKKAVICLRRESPTAKPPFFRPFHDFWDFSEKHEPSEDLLASVMPHLAVAGEQLYRRVFERECDENLKTLSHN